MARGIPEGITREHVLAALAEYDAGTPGRFAAPTGYDLVVNGRSYPPKAVIGLAARHVIGRVLQPDEFSSGIAAGQAVFVLRQLGFQVVRLAEDWTEHEVTLIVTDYFDMLRQELHGERYSKTEHRSRLSPRLNQRSNGSIEFKHQNISAVMVSLGLPYIEGYKPRGNYQALLAAAVDSYLVTHSTVLESFAASPRLDPVAPPALDVRHVEEFFVSPPEHMVVPQTDREPWRSRRGRKIDFARREAENRRLGKMGEALIVKLEKQRLSVAGRADLAERVEWVAETQGDGLGFDVLSYTAGEAEQFIEVKTTGLGQYHPFLVTANEVRCSEAVPEKFCLYRVFNFSTAPRVYTVQGALTQRCTLDPLLYRASY